MRKSVAEYGTVEMTFEEMNKVLAQEAAGGTGQPTEISEAVFHYVLKGANIAIKTQPESTETTGGMLADSMRFVVDRRIRIGGSQVWLHMAPSNPAPLNCGWVFSKHPSTGADLCFVTFSDPGGDIVTGWLEKKGYMFSTWNPRFFIFNYSTRVLQYFENEAEARTKNPSGVATVHFANNVVDRPGYRQNRFDIQAESTEKGQYLLSVSAFSAVSKKMWIRKFAAAPLGAPPSASIAAIVPVIVPCVTERCSGCSRIFSADERFCMHCGDARSKKMATKIRMLAAEEMHRQDADAEEMYAIDRVGGAKVRAEYGDEQFKQRLIRAAMGGGSVRCCIFCEGRGMSHHIRLAGAAPRLETCNQCNGTGSMKSICFRVKSRVSIALRRLPDLSSEKLGSGAVLGEGSTFEVDEVRAKPGNRKDGGDQIFLRRSDDQGGGWAIMVSGLLASFLSLCNY
jgi:hypothetical protein